MPPPFARTIHLEVDEIVEYDNNPVDTGLFFEVEAGEVYVFRFLVVYGTSDTSVAIQLGVTYPPAAIVATQVSGLHWPGPIPRDDWPVARPDRIVARASNIDHLAVIEGVLEPAADGILRVQYAPEASGAVVTVRRGSAGVLQAT